MKRNDSLTLTLLAQVEALQEENKRLTNIVKSQQETIKQLQATITGKQKPALRVIARGSGKRTGGKYNAPAFKIVVNQ